MVRYFLLGGLRRGRVRHAPSASCCTAFSKTGSTARELFETIFERVHPLFVASVEAAAAAGDLRAEPIASANRFLVRSSFGPRWWPSCFCPGRAFRPLSGVGRSAGRGKRAGSFLRGIGHEGHSDRFCNGCGCGVPVPTHTRFLSGVRLWTANNWYRRKDWLHDRTSIAHATTRKPRTFLWLVVVGTLLAVVLGRTVRFLNRFPRGRRSRRILRGNRPASRANQRRRGQDRGGAALCHRDRFGDRRSSGHDKSRDRRGVLRRFSSSREPRSKPATRSFQINDEPERGDPRQLRGAGALGPNHIGGARASSPSASSKRGKTVDQKAEPARSGAGDDHQDRGADRAKS